MHYNEDDRAIVQEMDEQGNNQYQRYLQNRFEVEEIFPMEEAFHSGSSIRVPSGNRLKDRRVVSITKDGEVFDPPKDEDVLHAPTKAGVPKKQGLCANIMDKETGKIIQVHTGDKLADGKIAKISEDGVIFAPPRADVPKFVIPHAQEMMPVGSEMPSRFREQMNEMFSREAQAVPDDDAVMIVLMEDTRVMG